ncbi:MAG: Rrf2 family transcriptional regulator [Proteobacteria bacterium]|nr:Rrf2 family transcriptional regulator [Pseudomonadota bacterium]
MLDLALHGGRGGVRTAEIAQRTAAPEKFLEAVMRDLQRAGFIASKRGPDGGHRLVRDPAHLTVGAIVEAIDLTWRGPGASARGRSAAARPRRRPASARSGVASRRRCGPPSTP